MKNITMSNFEVEHPIVARGAAADAMVRNTKEYWKNKEEDND